MEIHYTVYDLRQDIEALYKAFASLSNGGFDRMI